MKFVMNGSNSWILQCIVSHARKCLHNTTKSFNSELTFMKGWAVWTPSSERFPLSLWAVISLHIQWKWFQWTHLFLTEGRRGRKIFLVAMREKTAIPAFLEKSSEEAHGGTTGGLHCTLCSIPASCAVTCRLASCPCMLCMVQLQHRGITAFGSAAQLQKQKWSIDGSDLFGRQNF